MALPSASSIVRVVDLDHLGHLGVPERLALSRRLHRDVVDRVAGDAIGLRRLQDRPRDPWPV